MIPITAINKRRRRGAYSAMGPQQLHRVCEEIVKGQGRCRSQVELGGGSKVEVGRGSIRMCLIHITSYSVLLI